MPKKKKGTHGCGATPKTGTHGMCSSGHKKPKKTKKKGK